MKLWRYIQGYRKGKDAHKLEKEAMSDPFLAHALRGFDRVEGDHIRQIEQLRKDIRRKSTNKVRYLRAAGIAASILLVIGVGSYFIINQTRVTETLPVAVYYDLIPEESTPAVPPPVIAQQKKIEAPQPQVSPKTPKPVAVAEEQLDVSEAPLMVAEESADMAQEEVQATNVLDMIEVVAPYVSKKKSVTSAVSRVSSGDTGKVKGKVTDEYGDPIIGASVIIEGTNKGTVTDLDGYFELPADNGSKIRVDYIGYESLEKLVTTQDSMQFAMNEDKQTLDEVVVVGMGSRQKSVLKEPKPVDGMRKYKKYLKEKMVRPTEDECSDVTGKVVLRFHVWDGRPGDITIIESLCPSVDEEAIRLVEEGPDWTSGEKPVTLEIKF